MQFIDEAEIQVQGGRGGDGCASFRREMKVPKGGPDGGDGGQGGSVFIEADPHLSTLVELSGHHHWHAKPGHPGTGKNCTGRNGQDMIIRVPPGTLVYNRENGLLLRDLVEAGTRVCVAHGGRGGHGNARFASATHQTPREFERGGEPEERWLRLELKLIADVGIVGLPNAGKSTLLSRISRARPKIADYPFTTLVPNLGIVSLSGYRDFVVADIPGLIEGAHRGVGLGHDFLRHIERTRIILHLVDLFPVEGQPTPIEAYRTIRSELEHYSSSLASKPEIVAANKLDLSGEERPAELDAFSAEIGQEVHAISAVSGKGVSDLVNRLWQMLDATKREADVENLASR